MANTRALRPGETDDNNGLDWSYAPPAGGITNSTVDVSMKAAVAGKRNYLQSIQVSVGVALAIASEFVIKDGSTVIYRGSLAAATLVPASVRFDPPLKSSVNTALNLAAVSAFATGNLVVNAQGYTA